MEELPVVVNRSIFPTLFLLSCFLHISAPVQAQQADAPPATNLTANQSASPSTTGDKSWIVRDPVTGRLFQQQLVSVTVPVTKWEAKTVEQTVYEPQIATTVQNIPQTLFVPNTQYVMQPKLRGWWNPWKPPVQAYEYVPVTNWVPQTQLQQRVTPTQQWVPKQQKVVVYQPVQTTEVRQQLVQKELPQPQGASAMQPAQYAGARPQGQPLIRLPILAQQRGFGVQPNYASNWQSYGKPAPQWPGTQWPGTQSPGTQWNATQNAPQNQSLAYQPIPSQTPMQPTKLVLPPAMTNVLPGGYRAPLQSSASNIASRDTLQSGMQATELR